MADCATPPPDGTTTLLSRGDIEPEGEARLDAFPDRRHRPLEPPGSGPPRLVRAIRPDGGDRWLTVLPPDLAAPFAASATALAPAIERDLGPSVVANRWAAGATAMLEPRAMARARLRGRLRAIGPPGRGSTIVRSDVLACYPSIDLVTVASCLPPGEPRAHLLRTLERIHDRGGSGLPVGPTASAIVANAVLAAGDRAIAGTGALHVRWVDDVAIVADGRRQARRAFDAWRAELERLGLAVNPAKTAFDVDPRGLPSWMGSVWRTPLAVR